MRVIDMHTHIFPEKVAEKATLATAAYFDLPEDPNHYGTSTLVRMVTTLVVVG